MTEGRTSEVPGYGYGAPDTAHSPLGMEDLDLLKQTVLFTGADERYLRMAGDVLEDQIEDVLDVWYGFVGDHSHLTARMAPESSLAYRTREGLARDEPGH
jgi:Protoglobin